MNEITHFIFVIYNFNLMIRDTLEYTVADRKEFNYQVYLQKKHTLDTILKGPSPVRHFLDSNGETGKKIDSQLHEFLDDVYGPNSTIIRVSGEELRVDSAQHLTLYNYIVGLHETFTDIINGYMNFAKGKDSSDDDLEQLVHDDDYMYRVIVYMNIVADIEKTFIEFNQAMHETQGKPSPQSNFIINDLRRYIGFLKFVRDHNKSDDSELNTMMDNVEKLVSYMEGKETLPEGQQFPQVFESTKNEIKQLMAKAEQKWRSSFMIVYQQAVEFEKNRDQKKS